MRISEWSSDVCSSDLERGFGLALFDRVVERVAHRRQRGRLHIHAGQGAEPQRHIDLRRLHQCVQVADQFDISVAALGQAELVRGGLAFRSEEHTSELQSLMRISYAVFCLKKKKIREKE